MGSMGRLGREQDKALAEAYRRGGLERDARRRAERVFERLLPRASLLPVEKLQAQARGRAQGQASGRARVHLNRLIDEHFGPAGR